MEAGSRREAKLRKASESKHANKFHKLARELECDEDEARFDERFKRLVSAPKVPMAAKRS